MCVSIGTSNAACSCVFQQWTLFSYIRCMVKKITTVDDRQKDIGKTRREKESDNITGRLRTTLLATMFFVLYLYVNSLLNSLCVCSASIYVERLWPETQFSQQTLHCLFFHRIFYGAHKRDNTDGMYSRAEPTHNYYYTPFAMTANRCICTLCVCVKVIISRLSLFILWAFASNSHGLGKEREKERKEWEYMKKPT